LGSRMGVWAGVLCLLGGPPLRAAEPHPPPETPTAAAARATAAAPPDELGEARKRMKVLYDGITHIRRIRDATREALRGSCVDERLADARAHLRLGNDELATVESTLAHAEGEAAPKKGVEKGVEKAGTASEAAAARTRALARLDMLVERTRAAEHAAEVCVADDRSSVDVTEVKVEIDPQPAPDETSPFTPRP